MARKTVAVPSSTVAVCGSMASDCSAGCALSPPRASATMTRVKKRVRIVISMYDERRIVPLRGERHELFGPRGQAPGFLLGRWRGRTERRELLVRLARTGPAR